MQILEQRLQIDAAQGFGSNNQQAGPFFQCVAQGRQARGDHAVVPGLVEHHQRQRAVAAHRRKYDGALGDGG